MNLYDFTDRNILKKDKKMIEHCVLHFHVPNLGAILAVRVAVKSQPCVPINLKAVSTISNI